MVRVPETLRTFLTLEGGEKLLFLVPAWLPVPAELRARLGADECVRPYAKLDGAELRHHTNISCCFGGFEFAAALSEALY